MSKRIGIVGAGLGGLSAAIRLANIGFEVDVYEQNNNPGGKASEINENSFRFDTGPSLLTMPFVLEELFQSCNEDINDFLKIKKLDPVCKYFYPDGTVLNAYSDKDKFAKEIEQKTSDKSESIKNYLEYCKKIYELTADLFLYNSPAQLSTFLNSKALIALLNLNKIDPFRTMHEAVCQYFSDPKTIQLFDRYATYNGSDPYQAPATLNIIPHVEYNLGSFIPEGGIYSVTSSLKKLAMNKGVNFLLNTKVEKIIVEDQVAKRLKSDNVEKSYDSVISNVDVNYTFKHLMSGIETKESKRYSKLQPSFSGLVFYWGINKTFDQLETHNILFSSDYKKEFDALFVANKIPNDPTVYIYISSKMNPSDAPSGMENWFVMVNAPFIQSQDWQTEIINAKERITKKINRFLNTDISSHIIFEKQLSPIDIQNKTGSYLGSIYGISSNNRMSAFLRQPNRSRTIKNLYFCGGSSHPGGGIPLVILSGKITSELVQRDLL